MNPASRITQLFDRCRPGWTVQSISDRAEMPALYLQSWVTPEETGRPLGPPPPAVLERLATALETDVPAVHQAFDSTWKTLEGGYWSHFAPGDRVIVFGEPDPMDGTRRVRRGTVAGLVPVDTIEITLQDHGRAKYSRADEVRISHAAGACRCVAVLP